MTTKRGILRQPPVHPLDLAGRFAIAMSLIVVNAADIVTTRLLLADGGHEANPLAARLLDAGHLVAVKMTIVGLVGVLLLVAPVRRRVEQTLWIVVVLYSLVLTSHIAQLAGVTFVSR